MPDQEIPVLRRIINREPEEPQAAPMPAAERPNLHVVPLPGSQMTRQEQIHAALAHALRAARLRARETWRRDGGPVHVLKTGKPPSIGEHLAYGDSRAWVPHGHDGGIADRSGLAWNRTAGLWLVALGNGISATGHKPFRGVITWTLLYLLIALGLYGLGDHSAAVIMLGALGAVILAAVLAVLLWPARRLPQPVQPDGPDDTYEEELEDVDS